MTKIIENKLLNALALPETPVVPLGIVTAESAVFAAPTAILTTTVTPIPIIGVVITETPRSKPIARKGAVTLKATTITETSEATPVTRKATSETVTVINEAATPETAAAMKNEKMKKIEKELKELNINIFYVKKYKNKKFKYKVEIIECKELRNQRRIKNKTRKDANRILKMFYKQYFS